MGKRQERYLKMSKSDLSALSNDELFDAVIIRTEQAVDRYEDWEVGVKALNFSQKVFYSVNWLVTEVNNGGLCQFFVNSSRMVAPYVSDYMNIIGAVEHKKLFDNFVVDNKIDLNELSSFDIEALEEFEDQCERYPFDEYDDTFFAIAPLEEYLLKFAREHLEDF